MLNLKVYFKGTVDVISIDILFKEMHGNGGNVKNSKSFTFVFKKLKEKLFFSHTSLRFPFCILR